MFGSTQVQQFEVMSRTTACWACSSFPLTKDVWRPALKESRARPFGGMKGGKLRDYPLTFGSKKFSSLSLIFTPV